MEPATRINQNNLNRRLDGTLEAPILSDDTSEQYALAWLNERERIRLARQQEIQDERDTEDREKNATLKGKIENKIKEKIIEKLEDKIPQWANPIYQAVKLAQENQLRVQSLLLGLTDEPTPQVKGDYPDKDYNPPTFEMPASGSGGRGNVYRPLLGFGKGKMLTLAWNFRGYCSDVFLKNSYGGGLTTPPSDNSAIGQYYYQIYKFVPASWLFSVLAIY